MPCAGIDIGSRTIELVVVKDRKIIESSQADTGFDPKARAMGYPLDQIGVEAFRSVIFLSAFLTNRKC